MRARLQVFLVVMIASLALAPVHFFADETEDVTEKKAIDGFRSIKWGTLKEEAIDELTSQGEDASEGLIEGVVESYVTVAGLDAKAMYYFNDDNKLDGGFYNVFTSGNSEEQNEDLIKKYSDAYGEPFQGTKMGILPFYLWSDFDKNYVLMTFGDYETYIYYAEKEGGRWNNQLERMDDKDALFEYLGLEPETEKSSAEGI